MPNYRADFHCDLKGCITVLPSTFLTQEGADDAAFWRGADHLREGHRQPQSPEYIRARIHRPPATAIRDEKQLQRRIAQASPGPRPGIKKVII